MVIRNDAPVTQTIIRNEQDDDNAPVTKTIIRNEQNDDSEIIIKTLVEKYFDQARKIENEFTGSGKGLCFGMCPFSWCPATAEEFESTYRKDPDRCSTYGVAIRQVDDMVVGVITLRQGGQNADFFENLLHTPQKDELYIDHVAVTNEARGKGVGTKLLKWAEDKAIERSATKLTLGVMNGNPAKRLYDRFGFVNVSTATYVSCFLGMPNGQFGGIIMEKQL